MSRFLSIAAAAAAALSASVASADGGNPYSLPRNYVGAAGALVLPQGGARLHRAGGAVARAGRYFSDYFAVEAEAGRMERWTSFAARGIWHAQGWEWFGKLFGYERLDPFLSLGARGWAPSGSAGPCAGTGAFYYLGDTWSIRIDAEFSLGAGDGAETAHAFSVGIQCSF